MVTIKGTTIYEDGMFYVAGKYAGGETTWLGPIGAS